MSGNLIIPEEIITDKIYIIRNQKVMPDRDLATLYGVETRVLNQAVKRNIARFPDDFMLKVSKVEFDTLISQIVTSSWSGTKIKTMSKDWIQKITY
jgi:ORF6N domain